MSLRTKGELALVIAAAFWGSTFVVVKDALGDISPILYLVIRFWIGAALLLLWVRNRPSPVMIRGGIQTGIFVGIGMILQTIALQHTSASNVGFLTSLYIPLVPFVAALVYRVRTRWQEAVAVVLSTVGIGLISFDPSSASINPGDLMTIGAAVMFSFQIVFVQRYSGEGDAVWIAWFQVAMTAVVSTIALPMESYFVVWTPRLWIALAITVITATVLAYLLQGFGQRQTSATRAALIFATEPVFSCIASYFWLGERLSGRGWSGAFLVMLGILLAELKPGANSEHSSN